MFKKKKQRPMTLLEIMIVIFIIGIIGSVIGYNMKGSLEEGKAFKTQEGIKQLYEIFHLEMAKGTASIDDPFLRFGPDDTENRGRVFSG